MKDQPERMREVWAGAVKQDGPAPTAKHVRAVRVGLPPNTQAADRVVALIEKASGRLRELGPLSEDQCSEIHRAINALVEAFGERDRADAAATIGGRGRGPRQLNPGGVDSPSSTREER